MADYHPLIAKAVAGLEKNTGENRRALYERARIALVAQLRGVVPALDESEITRERLALEEAIRKVEADAVRHARETARPPIQRRLEIPRRDETARAAPQEPSAPRIAPQPPQPSRPPEPPSSAQPGAGRAAPSGDAAPQPRAGAEHETPPSAVPSAAANAERSDVAATPATTMPPPQPPPPAAPTAPARHPLAEYGSLEPQIAADNVWALPLDGTPPPEAPEQPAARTAPQPEELPPSPLLPTRGRAGLIGVGIIVVLIGGLAALAYWQWTPIRNVVTGLYGMLASSTPAQRQATAPARPKITDRIGQPGPQTAGAAVQRVVLYEEDPEDPHGKRYTGTVTWRTETKSVTPGRSPELVVRADIEIPERKMGVTWTLRRNTDPSLPASHTIEIVFNLPPDSPTGGVYKVPGVLMKQSEQTRGLPLAGVAAEMPPAYFLIGLSSVETDVARNIQLLKERPWFDIPIVYKNNRRAILAMEKGPPGEKAFNEAFAAWKQ